MATINAEQVLQKCGVIGEDRRINKSIVLTQVDDIMKNEMLKEEVLNYILKYYKARLA